MTNILFVYQRKMATTEGLHESFTSKDALRHGLNSRFVNTWHITGRLLAWADILVFVRNHDLLAQWILKKAKRNGVFIIQFFDDDVLSLPRSEVNRVQFLPWRKKAVGDGFKNTDVILSSNFLLAKKYAQMIPSGRSTTMDMVIDPKTLVSPEQKEKTYKEDNVKIVFAAGSNHEDMFYRYIGPVLPALIEKYGKRLSFTFFGVHPDMSAYKDKIDVEYIGAMSLDKYRKAIQKGNFDLGLSPLVSNDFTQYKYFNKFIEYTIAGITGIYSNVLPYTLAVSDKVNGFLSGNTSDAWYQTMSLAIENAELRKYCYRNAYNYLLQHMDVDSVMEKLKSDIPEMKKEHVEKGPISVLTEKIQFVLIRCIECVYLVLEYIRSAGISGAARKIKSYIKEQKIAKEEKLGE